MLAVKRLNVYYGQSQILWNIDMTVPQGAVVCLIGRNGVGKTTLLKSIIGLLSAKQGTVSLAGQEVTK